MNELRTTWTIAKVAKVLKAWGLTIAPTKLESNGKSISGYRITGHNLNVSSTSLADLMDAAAKAYLSHNRKAS